MHINQLSRATQPSLFKTIIRSSDEVLSRILKTTDQKLLFKDQVLYRKEGFSVIILHIKITNNLQDKICNAKYITLFL